VRVALGSDDPPYWGATIGGEYAQARRTFGLSGTRLRAITRTALEAAFVPPAVRNALLARLGAR
jgi:adenosine deaminase